MRHLTETDVAAWVQDTLLSPDRTRPIVAVTSHPHSDRAWIDAKALGDALGDLAEVVFLVTGEATWALADALPGRLDVYGGALRIWWPGLTIGSEPNAHRLYFLRSPDEAARAFDQIVAVVRERAGLPPAAARPRAPATAPIVPLRTAPPEPPEVVRVTLVAAGRVEVASATHRGPVLETDLPPAIFAEAVQVGTEFTARPLRPQGDGTWAFSTVGLLPSPWQRFVAEVHNGDVVIGRVQNVHTEKRLVFVDLLPGVVGVCHVTELDYGFVGDMQPFARPGQLLAFEVLQIIAPSMSLQLSRKRAHGQPPRPLPSLVEGGRPFVWKDGMPLFENLRHVQLRAAAGGEPTRLRIKAPHVAFADRAGDPAREDQLEALGAELAAANDERSNLVAQIRQLRQQVQEAKKELRAAEDRHAGHERRSPNRHDPLASERAFLLGVRMSYARQFDEDDRLRQPLQRMRVGREFLASVRTTDGIEVEKVLEVCAQVAADLAHTIAGRDVHPLRAGSRGADSHTRKRDGAQAWRCALQQKSPSARRLHWWNVPGPDGATIEFACIGLHDSFDIPE